MPGLRGVGFLISCIWDFAAHGQGTLAPMAPPKVLVTHGFYRYTRNPMYLGVLGILLSEALFFSSLSLLIYPALILGSFHLFVVGYEEPHLRREFGEAYTAYCRTTPRWGVRFRTDSGDASPR
ncbi:isoprenylcysteine carboxylmethyltransferase family protein [candidate division KSB1 bacterium]|nr:isoprenylcysteine carboxylmethyltransferase family protein [candidate division KSB1 bacterium]